MGAALKILSDIRSLGGSIEVVSQDKLRVAAPHPLSDDLTRQVKAHKPEIIQMLLAQATPSDLPPEWLAGVGQLKSIPVPSTYPTSEWQWVISDAQNFIRSHWASQAHRLVWRVADLFGVNPEAPHTRWDGAGLIPLLHGRQIAAITNLTATIKCEHGVVQTFYRRKHTADAVAIWLLK